MITQHELQNILDYNQLTGVFVWKNPTKYKRSVLGKKAGSLTCNGYIGVRINKKSYLMHRLAWLYVYGKFPNNHIDHINGNRIDNRIINLRDVPQRENARNQKTHRDGHLVGSYFHKGDQKWMARIQINNKQRHIGSFLDQISAHQAYKDCYKEQYGYCPMGDK